jgi:dynein heavy chain 1
MNTLCGRREQFIDWISQLPDTQTPSWLGLPNNAEKVLLTTRGNDMVAKLLRMQNLDLEDDVNYSSVDESRDMDGRPSWMRSLSISAAQWLSVVPEVLCLFILVLIVSLAILRICT